MRLDEVAGEGRQVEDLRLDFFATRSVLVKNELHVLKFGGPVSAYKYTNFNNAKLLKKTTLATLPYNEHLKHFSIANLANTFIVLTGGLRKGWIASAKTFMLIVKRGKWV